MSGIFAAIMIGMGRAVGETMIVVMAAGNTPILDWNVFNGLRALSANIAVELPEAVKDGSLYRMLFLAALVAVRDDLRREHARRARAPALPQARGGALAVAPSVVRLSASPRRADLRAYGEPWRFAMGGALALGILLIVGLPAARRLERRRHLLARPAGAA